MKRAHNRCIQPAVTARHVVIAQFGSGGHRLMYVRVLAEHALARGDRVTLALGFDPAGEELFDLHLGHLGGQVEVIRLHRDILRDLTATVRLVRGDHTVLPDGDRMAMRIGAAGRWWGPGSVSVLVMREPSSARGSPVQRASGWVKRGLMAAADRRRVRVYRLTGGGGVGRTGPGYIADPIMISDDAEARRRVTEEWGVSPDRTWFAVVGAITRRKNLDLVADALFELDPSRVGLMVAGRSTDDARAIAGPAFSRLSDAGAALVDIDRLLTEAEIDAAVGAADAVVLAHSNEGPSGILGKAVVVGTAVIAAGALSLRADTRLVSNAQWVPLTVQDLSRACAVVLQTRPVSERPARSTATSDVGTGQADFLRLLS